VKRRGELGVGVRRAAFCLLPWIATSCETAPTIEPIVMVAVVQADADAARRVRDEALERGVDVPRARLDEALAAARRARSGAPADFRIACMVQDLEFLADPRAAREQYAAATGTAQEKTLAARALLPERLSEARDLLLKACDQEPAFGWARYGLAWVENELGRSDQALVEAMTAVRLEPSLLEALRFYAELAGVTGAREQALWARRELVAATGGDLRERRRYADLLLESNSKREAAAAEVELRAILAEIGEPPPPAFRKMLSDVYVAIGSTYAQRYRYDEAIVTWRHALQLDFESLTALANIGGVELNRAGDTDGAVRRRHQESALAAYEEYLLRAQGLSTPLPSDEISYRYFTVPEHVLTLRKLLGLPAEEEETVEETDLGPRWPEAGR
jgi:tetratricopeptide (TPR) repeat protein